MNLLPEVDSVDVRTDFSDDSERTLDAEISQLICPVVFSESSDACVAGARRSQLEP
jgi:hypothetical protein